MRCTRLLLLLFVSLFAFPAVAQDSRQTAQELVDRLAIVESEIVDLACEVADIRTQLLALLAPVLPPVPEPPVVVEPPTRPEPPPVEPPTRPVDPPSQPRPPPTEPPSSGGPIIIPRPAPPATPVEPVPAPTQAPWLSVGGAELSVETDDGIAIWAVRNVTPGVVRVLKATDGRADYPLLPRAAAAVVVGDTAAWAKRAAVKAWDVESQIPEVHNSWLLAQQGELGTPSVATLAGYLVAWDSDKAQGVPMGGGQGIPPYGIDWQRNARGLERALFEWIGVLNREPIHFDPAALTEAPLMWFGDPYTIPEYALGLLPEYAAHPLHPFRPHGYTHANRAFQAAVFLAEWTDLESPRAWLQRYWDNMSLVHGWGVEEGRWWQPQPNRIMLNMPWWKRMELVKHVEHEGWLGRGFAHQVRFALEMERLGMGGDPEVQGTPAHWLVTVRQLIKDVWDNHPRKGKSGARLLQFGLGGSSWDGMSPDKQQLGVYAAAIENHGLWVRELQRLGFPVEARQLREHFGPHPEWIVLVHEEIAPGYVEGQDPRLRFGPNGWHNGQAPWFHMKPDYDGTLKLKDVTVPFNWQLVYPGMVSAEYLFATIPGWWGMKDHPLAYLAQGRRKQLLGW